MKRARKPKGVLLLFTGKGIPMRQQLHLAVCCSLMCVMTWTGCQMGNDGPITSKLAFRGVPKQSEPAVESEEEIETRRSEESAQE
ncbi:MAG TPA: hypothetical protein DIT97_01690 [Gimesia maris]|uniref:Uncharacterized protein n=2 Tax=Gimesia maris TaxID=122 RepID=A0A3D3R0R0_9PLAN|nr:hypothetical protein [Gimesia maris]|tara:strand:+ start:140 stop:394 length:255 start_codon:yes stop_codon:yes gene_type:complete